jgi:hypothetical protein
LILDNISKKEIDLDAKFQAIDINEQMVTATVRSSDSKVNKMASSAMSVNVETQEDESGSSVGGSVAVLGKANQVPSNAPAVNETWISSLNQDILLDKLSLMERAIVGNNYEKKFISFRNVPDDGYIERKRIESMMRNEDEEVNSSQTQLEKGRSNK